MKKRWMVCFFTLAVAVGFAFTASAEVGVTDTEIVIGSHQDLSGPIAGWGTQVKMGLEMRAKEINDGESPLLAGEDQPKPVVQALREIAEGLVVPSTHQEMDKLREARRVLRERALLEAEEDSGEDEEEEGESYASAQAAEEPEES